MGLLCLGGEAGLVWRQGDRGRVLPLLSLAAASGLECSAQPGPELEEGRLV